MDFFGIPITIPPKRYIANIVPTITIEEIHQDDIVITDHPVEQNASISDHAYKRPVELILRCGWSNSSFDAGFNDEYVQEIYDQLLALQNARTPFPVQTGKRFYPTMLIESLQTTTNEKTESALFIQARLREVIIVQTTTTVLPPLAQQAEPEKTAEVVNSGVKSALPATPSPGGALPVPSPKIVERFVT